MSNLKNIMNKVLETVCVFIFAFITVVGTYQIVVRYVFNSPSTVSEELLTYSFTWLALLAAALVFGMKEHMAMTYFADKIKGKKRIILNLIIEVIVMLFAISVLIFGGISITRLTMTQVTASLGIPMRQDWRRPPSAAQKDREHRRRLPLRREAWQAGIRLHPCPSAVGNH